MIPNINDHYLVIDADTFFSNQFRLLKIINVSNYCQDYYHKPYFDHLEKLNNELFKRNHNYSAMSMMEYLAGK